MKKRKTGSKGKEKVGTSVWVDARMTLAQANEVFTPEEIRKFQACPLTRW